MVQLKKETIIDLAHEDGLDVVELTTGSNGYPAGLGGHAVIGFSDSEDLIKFMATVGYNVELHEFHSRNGWHFYNDAGWTDKVEYSIDDYLNKLGENYEVVDENRIKELIKNRLNDFDVDVDELDGLILDLKEYSNTLDILDSNLETHTIYRDGVEYDEVIISPNMSHDTHLYSIGLFLPADYNDNIK